MILLIKPYEGVGLIRFGMTVNEVRALMDCPCRQFKRALSNTFTDSFGALGLFVCYDAENKCDAIEMGKRSCPTLFGMSIIGHPIGEIGDWLKSRDPDLVFGPSGYKSFKCGISVYAPNKELRLADPVEGVLAFSKGYYERQKPHLAREPFEP